MKNQTLFEKLRTLLARKGKKKGGNSPLSQKCGQHHFKGKQLGGTSRKKSLLEKWQSKREERSGQRTSPLPGRESTLQRSLFRKVFLVAGVVVCGYLVLQGPMQSLFGNVRIFRIHEIEISGCVVTSPKGLRKFADISYEINMLTLDPKAIRQRLEEHPWVEQAEIRRVWPDRLAVTIKEYRPHALMVKEGNDGFQYLDRNGTLFASVAPGQELDFPVITGLDSFSTEEERKQHLDTVSLFLRLAGRNNPNLPAQNISEIHFDGNGELILYLVEQPFPIYFGKGEIKRKYYQLRRVLGELYRRTKGRAMIESVAYIRMDYQEDKVLVAKNHAG